MKIFIRVFALLIILGVIGAGVFFVSQNVKKNSMINTKNTMEKTENIMKKEDEKQIMMTDTNKIGQYIEYSKTAFDQNSNKKRVLFFYANWCPVCQPADKSIKENSGKIPADVVVIRVNYNDSDTDQEEKALAQKYGITYQHTFVQIDGEGKEVIKWNGGQLDELLAKMQ
ncbi:MAG: thioredoxin fold domain-containing protein [Candidatus Pacebacteria bacterium]|nr:thioredoxin fold domain-containing protein [Candidatus Paceibacterota bacterium]